MTVGRATQARYGQGSGRWQEDLQVDTAMYFFLWCLGTGCAGM